MMHLIRPQFECEIWKDFLKIKYSLYIDSDGSLAWQSVHGKHPLIFNLKNEIKNENIAKFWFLSQNWMLNFNAEM